jgi:hypothetical protein
MSSPRPLPLKVYSSPTGKVDRDYWSELQVSLSYASINLLLQEYKDVRADRDDRISEGTRSQRYCDICNISYPLKQVNFPRCGGCGHASQCIGCLAFQEPKSREWGWAQFGSTSAFVVKCLNCNIYIDLVSGQTRPNTLYPKGPNVANLR